jgi:hypothetical protein
LTLLNFIVKLVLICSMVSIVADITDDWLSRALLSDATEDDGASWLAVKAEVAQTSMSYLSYDVQKSGWLKLRQRRVNSTRELYRNRLEAT